MNDIPLESGLYFENRNTGMWWAIFRYDVFEWGWWQGEVQCFDIKDFSKGNSQDAFEQWKHIANANSGYTKSADFKDPKDIAELVKSF